MRLNQTATVWMGLFLLQVVPATSAWSADTRVPVPDAAAIQAAGQGVREAYGDEISAARTSGEKETLSKQLIEDGLGIKNDTASQFIILEHARQLAIDSGSLPTSIRATAAISLTFQLDEFDLRADTINSLIAKGKALPEVTRVAVQSIYDALGMDDLEHAKKFATLAFTGARLSRHQGLMRYAGVIRSEIPRVAIARDKWKSGLAKLETEPDNPETNEYVGVFACLIQGNWQALNHLEKAADKALAEAAKQDLATKADATTQVATGDTWWALADKAAGIKRHRMLHRAKHWYERALPTLSGFAVQRIKARLLQKEPPNAILIREEDRIRISGFITGHERVIVSNETISWQRMSRRYKAPQNVKLNGRAWNYGTPEKRDDLPVGSKFNYDKAKVIKLKSRGTVKLIPSANGVILEIVDSPGGGSTFDLILILPPA